MTHYIIKPDGFNYKEFAMDQDDYLDNVPDDCPYSFEELMRFGLNDVQLAAWWKPIEGRFTVPQGLPDRPTPDITPWVEAALILSVSAYEKVKDVMTDCGEFLQIQAHGETFYLFNCLNYDPNKPIYKTKFDNCSNVYCHESVKDLVENSDLNGVVFDTNYHNPAQ